MTNDSESGELKRAMQALEESLEIVASLSDPADRLRALSAMAKAYKQTGIQAAECRSEVMRTLEAAGYTYEELARLAGVTKSRVQQILGKVTRTPKPGKIEHVFAVKAAELRGRGLANLGVAAALVPEIRRYYGGARLSQRRIAGILEVSLNDVKMMDVDLGPV